MTARSVLLDSRIMGSEGDAEIDPIGAAIARATDTTSAEAAKVAGNLLTRLLGPAADVVGEQWAARIRERNLLRLLEKTAAREREGTVHPRLAAQTFDAAQYAEDELVTEYFSGVLSSSQEPDGKNDAGVPWTALVSRLSSDQIRLHFIVYASSRPVFQSDSSLQKISAIHNKEMVLDLASAIESFGGGDWNDALWVRWSDAVDGLMREGLIGGAYHYGPRDDVISKYTKGKKLDVEHDAVFRFQTTIHGARLFVWAVGEGEHSIDRYLESAVEMDVVDTASSVPMVPTYDYDVVLVEATPPEDASEPVDG